MTRLTLEQTGEEALIVMAGGNPGAMSALMEIVKECPNVDPFGVDGMMYWLDLDTLEIYESRIYSLWNDVCNRSTACMITVLRAHQLGFIDKKTLN